ncbi:MAG: FCD domain-containing protein, partial [Clostridia bacterium]|nr:FCD domain-containing protein [Clostridia bacterium]
SEEQLAVLREAVEFQEFYLSKNDADKIKTMDSRFHETIYRMSGSSVLSDVLIPLHRKIQKYRRASISNRSRAEASVAEHRAIFEAISAGDSKAAKKLLDEHLENAYNHMFYKD